MYITLQAFVHRGLRPSKVRYSAYPIAVPNVLSQRSSISVLRPRGSWHNSMVSEVQAPIYNLIPFQIIADLASELHAGIWMGFWISFLGNIVMFLPLGFCPALLWHRITFRIAL